MAAVAFHTYCQPETVSTISWANQGTETPTERPDTGCRLIFLSRL